MNNIKPPSLLNRQHADALHRLNLLEDQINQALNNLDNITDEQEYIECNNKITQMCFQLEEIQMFIRATISLLSVLD